MMRSILLLTTAVLLAGCTYPASQTEQGTAAGQIYFPGAPPDARILVDGREVGLAGSFDGRQTLSVAPGTHRVVVNAGGNTLIDKKYYVDSGSKVAVKND
jgi:hypothetical protein